ncbi:MAG: hypothetical protein ACP5D6_06300 [Kosmotogaceae bacterium]
MKKKIFTYIVNIVRKYGQPLTRHGGIFELKLGFLSIWWENSWFANRNVEHLMFDLFNKTILHLTREGEPIPF